MARFQQATSILAYISFSVLVSQSSSYTTITGINTSARRAIVSSTPTPFLQININPLQSITTSASIIASASASTSSLLAASLSAEYDNSNNNNNSNSNSNSNSGDTSLGEKVRTVTVAYIHQISQALEDTDDDEVDNDNVVQDEDNTNTNKPQRKRVVLDVQNNAPTFTYEITLPITATATTTTTTTATTDSNTAASASTIASSSASATAAATTWNSANDVGLTLAQTTRTGDSTTEISESRLQVDDTLRSITLEEQTVLDQKYNTICTNGEDGIDGSVQILVEDDQNNNNNNIGTEIKNGNGIVVSRVVRGGLAWKAGVRAGDKLLATSATMGEKIWPKSTLDGVRSAISSRKLMSSTMKFQFQRSDETLIGESELVQEFELSLSRPMGIHIEDTKDGFVQISGFTDDVPTYVKSKLQVGDRIIAADASLGSKLWPISSVEGAVSAVTTRLPGQPVRLRFERVVKSGTDLSSLLQQQQQQQQQQQGNKRENSSLANDLLLTYTKYQTKEEEILGDTNTQLLSRCRDVLKRYISVYDPTAERSTSRTGVPALVADRVLEALADASASIDAKTLSLLMNSYIVCNKPKDALNTFEAAVGLSADGSSIETKTKIEGKKKGGEQIIPSRNGLNLYTATDLIRAHSLLGDAASATRVLAAMEGKVDMNVDKIKVMEWNTKLNVDTKCYNTVLAAIANSQDLSIDVAEELYNTMCEPVLFNTPRPKKNVVTYNTMISAYARIGRRKDAFALLKEMMDAGLKPDKYTITSLVKSVVEDEDIDTARNLLSDMKKAGIKGDVVGYNIVIRALCDKSQWFEAKQIVAEMEARGISPDGKTYGLLMNGLLRLNKPGPCLTLFESACADQRTAVLTENVQLYTTAITAAATIGDYERALELVSRMTFAGVKPNMKTLTALMGACITGNQSQFAVDVYKKIENPDGYAMLIGVRGYCLNGDFDTALNIVDQNRFMSGKQIMSSYNYIIGSALKVKNFAIARQAMDVLLENNFIPSKFTFKAILENLGLLSKAKRTQETIVNNSETDLGEEFQYLLYVLDGLDKRKLQSTGQMYSCLLLEGARLGGLYRKIASLIAKSRSDAFAFDSGVSLTQMDENRQPKLLSWYDLLQNYSNYKEKLHELELPNVRVRINEREIRHVLQAENGVSYGYKRRRSFAGSRAKR